MRGSSNGVSQYLSLAHLVQLLLKLSILTTDIPLQVSADLIAGDDGQ